MRHTNHIFVRFAVLVASLLATHGALAAGVMFFVPVDFRGIPPEFTTARVACSVDATPATHSVIPPMHFKTSVPITAGAVRGRVAVAVIPVTEAIVPPDGNYLCGADLLGPGPDGRGIDSFAMPSPEGWHFTTSTERDAGYIPVAPGTPVSARTQRRIPPEAIAEMNLHGECPCGCGGDFDSGTALCDPSGTTRLFAGLYPYDKNPNGVPGNPAPPRRLALPRPPRPGGSLIPREPRVPITVTTGALYFTGTGKLTRTH